MNDVELTELWEKAVCGGLTAAEQARFQAQVSADPALLARWEEEQALNRMLRELPDAPVPSNFTARVLQAVESDARAAVPRTPRLPWVGWVRTLVRTRVAVAVAGVALVTGLVIHQHRESTLRAQLAESVSAFSSFAALPSVEILQDFEVIARLDQTPAGADEELLAALQ